LDTQEINAVSNTANPLLYTEASPRTCPGNDGWYKH